MPEDKREQEFGDDNPVPLVEFLNIDDEVAASHDPIVRESPKTGRNDPCPCGSGKKFKKCCGA
ncbi:SEC-C metal-binding domain-containing protein [Methylogaea oryzae]|uniref:SEC-C metal-binding domain-containing protein n=1 Tax=Methylogaea oryzae TaxID=1295382 RepID=UPI0006D27231